VLALISAFVVLAEPAQASSGPVIKVQPKSVRAVEGKKVTFSVRAVRVKKYQWQRSSKSAWKAIPGAKSAKYSLTARSSAAGTRYRVKVISGKKHRYSRAVSLSVVRPSVAPVVDPLGSRTNPVPVWSSFSSGAWGFVLEPTDTNAWAKIRSANMFNDPPLSGFSYIMVSATATYRGVRTGVPWLNTSAEFLGSDGRIYDASSNGQSCGVVPQSINDVDDMYPGASARGNYCAVVPTSAIAGGLWRVKGDTDSYSSGVEVFARIG